MPAQIRELAPPIGSGHTQISRHDGLDRVWRALLALADDQLARWPTLSPGERRRWQLAAVLAGEPDMLALGLGGHAWCLVIAARCTAASWRIAAGTVEV